MTRGHLIVILFTSIGYLASPIRPTQSKVKINQVYLHTRHVIRLKRITIHEDIRSSDISMNEPNPPSCNNFTISVTFDVTFFLLVIREYYRFWWCRFVFFFCWYIAEKFIIWLIHNDDNPPSSKFLTQLCQSFDARPRPSDARNWWTSWNWRDR